MKPVTRRLLRNYAFYFAVWTLVGLFFFSQALTQKILSGEPTPWPHYLASWLVGVSLWALLTPPIFWLGHRFPFERKHWLRRTALHLVIGIAISLGQLTVEA